MEEEKEVLNEQCYGCGKKGINSICDICNSMFCKDCMKFHMCEKEDDEEDD